MHKIPGFHGPRQPKLRAVEPRSPPSQPSARESWVLRDGVKDMAHAEAQYGGWLGQLLTHPVKGLENYGELFEKLTSAKGAIKIYCEVAEG